MIQCKLKTLFKKPDKNVKSCIIWFDRQIMLSYLPLFAIIIKFQLLRNKFENFMQIHHKIKILKESSLRFTST